MVDTAFWQSWLNDEPAIARACALDMVHGDSLTLEGQFLNDDVSATLAEQLGLCETCAPIAELFLDRDAVNTFLAKQRANNPALRIKGRDDEPDAEHDSNGLSAELRTLGGLYEPWEDDRTASLNAEYYSTVGGLSAPSDRSPDLVQRLKALYFQTKPEVILTEEQRRYRGTHGGLLAPDW